MAQGRRIQPQHVAVPLGDGLLAEQVVGDEAADGLLAVPQRGDGRGARADDAAAVVPQRRDGSEARGGLAREDPVHVRRLADRHHAVALVADAALLVNAVGAPDRLGLLADEPQAQPVEPQAAAAQLDGAAAQPVEGIHGAQLVGDRVEGGQALVEAALGILAPAQRVAGGLESAAVPSVLEGGARRGRHPDEVRDRLDDVVVEARPHRRHRHLLGARAREHQDRAVGAARLDGLEHRQAVAPVEVIVGDDQVELATLERPLEPRQRGHLFDLAAGELASELAQRQLAVVGVVVNEQEPRRRLAHACSSACVGDAASGSSIQNRLPLPGSDSMPTRPPMRSMPRRTMARPTPVPA